MQQVQEKLSIIQIIQEASLRDQMLKHENVPLVQIYEAHSNDPTHSVKVVQIKKIKKHVHGCVKAIPHQRERWRACRAFTGCVHSDTRV